MSYQRRFFVYVRGYQHGVHHEYARLVRQFFVEQRAEQEFSRGQVITCRDARQAVAHAGTEEIEAGEARVCAQAQRLFPVLQQKLHELIEGEKLVLRRQSLEPGKLLADCIRQGEGLARKMGVQLGSRLEGAIGTVDADPELTARVLANLVTNAVKHTPDRTSVSVSNSAPVTGLSTKTASPPVEEPTSVLLGSCTTPDAPPNPSENSALWTLWQLTHSTREVVVPFPVIGWLDPPLAIMPLTFSEGSVIELICRPPPYRSDPEPAYELPPFGLFGWPSNERLWQR